MGNPTNDADAIASTLRGMGFARSPKWLTSTVQGFAEAALASFSTAGQPGADVALFYYSGHGLQLNSENYLIAVDATLDFDTSLRCTGRSRSTMC